MRRDEQGPGGHPRQHDELRPDFSDPGALQEDSPDDLQEVAERIGEGRPLEDLGHRLHRVEEPGEDDGREEEEEDGEKGFLLGAREGRDQELEG